MKFRNDVQQCSGPAGPAAIDKVFVDKMQNSKDSDKIK